MFFSSIGELSITNYTIEEESDGDKDHYFTRIASHHSGALSFRSISQRPIQRVSTLTMFKIWVFIYKTLKYSTEYLDEYDLCKKIIHDVETRLNNKLQRGFPICERWDHPNNRELRWRDKAGRAASKSIRLSSILQSQRTNFDSVWLQKKRSHRQCFGLRWQPSLAFDGKGRAKND